MKAHIEDILMATLARCFTEGALKEVPVPRFVVEIPGNPDHGHFASNLALTLAGSQRRRPSEIAAILLNHLQDETSLLDGVTVEGPGFLNFRVKDLHWYRTLGEILHQGKDYGRSGFGAGKRVLVEFVSANPTGPLHLGHGRGAALGDTLCRILSFCGYEVTREFYINDAGAQVRLLGLSIYARIRQREDPSRPFPENGYHGEYIQDLADRILSETDIASLSEEKATALCAEEGKRLMLEELRGDLERFRVPFDRWTSERSLFSSGFVEDTLDLLSREGRVYEKDGALWIKTSTFGDDKDRVLRKGDGEYTYFASDLAYHLQKYARGYDRVVDIWGADHHGYIPRVRAGLRSRGIPDDWLTVILLQLVKLWKAGAEVKMSKRAGTFVTLRELLDEVGVDAARFMFLTKNHDASLDFDIDKVTRQDSDNPVFYVQYAHARACSIFRKAEEAFGSLPPWEGVLDRLLLEEEKALIRAMVAFPSLLLDAAKAFEPHRLTYYLTELAASFHQYFNKGNREPGYRVVTGDRPLTAARLALAEAVRTTLRTGLTLLGTEAPDRM